jgi:hypothetical protein
MKAARRTKWLKFDQVLELEERHGCLVGSRCVPFVLAEESSSTPPARIVKSRKAASAAASVPAVSK